MSISKIKSWGGTYWLPCVLYLVMMLVFGALLWFRLGSLPGGYSVNELRTFETSISLKDIFNYPLNAPFTVIVHGLTYLTQHSLLLTRLVATGFGLLTISFFYWLVRHWHGERTAILGTILFGASAWFLHTARLGTPDVMLFLLLAFVACGVWLKHRHSAMALLVCFGLAVVLMYVPGMVWFVVLAAIWQWRMIDHAFKQHLWVVSLGALVLLAAMAPLGLAIYHDPSLAKAMAGLPTMGWPMPLDIVRNLAHIPLDLFIRNEPNPETWLGRVPVLDLFSFAMFGLGTFLYGKKIRLGRSQLLFFILVAGAALISLGGAVTLTVIMPFIYILVAAGVGYMCDQWFKVFPRNPIAKGLDMGLIILAVAGACAFYFRHYYIAWPHAEATKAVFTVQES